MIREWPEVGHESRIGVTTFEVIMIQDKQIASVALRLMSIPFALIGVVYMMVPLLVCYKWGLLPWHPSYLIYLHSYGGDSFPYGALTGYPSDVLLWVKASIHPVLGLAMIYTSILVWRRYTPQVFWRVWILFGAAAIMLPYCIVLTMFFGK